jgi:hypothetical protein
LRWKATAGAAEAMNPKAPSSTGRGRFVAGAAGAQLDGKVRACFSDQNCFDKLFDKGSLAVKGVALLALTANAILEADDSSPVLL